MGKLINVIKPDFEKLVPYKKRLEEALSNASSTEICNAHIALAKALFYQRQYQEGLDEFDAAILLAKSEGNKKLAAQYIGLKGSAYVNAKIPEEGYLCFQNVLEMGEELEDKELISDALGGKGSVYLETGDPAIAKDKFIKALDLAEEIEDETRIMVHKGNLGNVALIVAAAEEAAEYFTDALTIAKKLGDKQSQAGYLTNLAVLRNDTQNYDEAIELFENVRELTNDIKNNNGELNALNHLIKIYSFNNKQTERILIYIERVIELSVEMNDKMTEMRHRNMQILTLMNFDRYGDAIRLIHQYLEDLENKDDKNWRLNLLTNLGNAHYDNDETNEAIAAYKNALTTARETGNNNSVVKLLGRLGAIHADMGDLKTSNEYLLEAIEDDDKVSDKILLGQQYCLLAMNYKESDDNKTAVEFCDKAIEVYNQSGSKLHAEQAEKLLKQIRG